MCVSQGEVVAVRDLLVQVPNEAPGSSDGLPEAGISSPDVVVLAELVV